MEIEERFCFHGEVCSLYTVTKPTHKSYGKSLYVCSRSQKCHFKEEGSFQQLKPCPLHGSLIKVCTFKEVEGDRRIMYYCEKGKGDWCGSWSIEPENKENVNPHESSESTKSIAENEREETRVKKGRAKEESESDIHVEEEDKSDDTEIEEEEEIVVVDGSVYSSEEQEETDIDNESEEEEEEAVVVYSSEEQEETFSDNESEEEEEVKSKMEEEEAVVDGSEYSSEEQEETFSDNESEEEEEVKSKMEEEEAVVDGSEYSSEEQEETENDNESEEEEEEVKSKMEEEEAVVDGSEYSSEEQEETENDNKSDKEKEKSKMEEEEADIESEEEEVKSKIEDVDESQYSNESPDSPMIANSVSDHEQSFKKYRKTPVMIMESDDDEYQDKESSEEEKEKEDDSREEEIRGDRHEEESSGEEAQDKTTEEVESDLTFVHNEVNATSKAPLSANISSATKDHESTDAAEGGEKFHQFKLGHQFRKLVKQLADNRVLQNRFGSSLPDGGAKLRKEEDQIKQRMIKLRGYIPGQEEINEYLTKDSNVEEGAPVKQKLFSNAMFSQAKALTVGAVQHLHSSLETCPTEDTLADDPKGLKISLMIHQKRGLAWLKWREEQIPRGGILADDMGLGKTLSMISLILDNKKQSKFISRSRNTDDNILSTHGTLVVVPLTLLRMWETEVKSKVKPGLLSVTIYHGANRAKDPYDLVDYDIVLTTYNIVGIEVGSLEGSENLIKKSKAKRSAASTTLFQLFWERVILDEAHNIRNSKTATSIGCCALHASSRWAMTGTPIQNKLEDFYSLIKFLRLSPFDDLRVWKDTIGSKSQRGMQRLNAMVTSLVLRRTKEEMTELNIIDLPKKTFVTHELDLEEAEKKIYDVIFHEGRGFFQRYLVEQGEGLDVESPPSDDLLAKLSPHVAHTVKRILSSMIPEYSMMERSAKGRTVLVLLLRLRQCCSHLNLLCTALDSSVLDETDLSLAMSAISLTHLNQDSIRDIPMEFQKQRPSTKVKKIITELVKIFENEEEEESELPNKCIIVSQWTSMLQLLEVHLQKINITFTKLDGKVPAKDRQKYVNLFNAPEPDPRVMLLSLQAGGVGLTLTGANHVFIIDLHWNPQLEQQASDRCHRVGQTRDVVLHRFITKDTVEVGIQRIQQNKLQLASNVLSGANKKNRGNIGLSLDDLKHLFEI